MARDREKDRRTAVKVRLGEDQRAALETAARAAGESLPVWCRRALLAAAGLDPAGAVRIGRYPRGVPRQYRRGPAAPGTLST